MAIDPERRRFTVDEFHRMGEVGILDPEDRLELLDGEIVEMTPIGAEHAASVERLAALLRERLPTDTAVRVQNPVRLGPRSEPVPDLAVVDSRADFYAGGHPRPADVHLVVEVAASSREYDRAMKLPRYAAAGIREAWLVDLQARAVEVHADPGPDGYREVATPDRICPAAFPNLILRPVEILG